MQRGAISHARLMRESTDRVESALRSGDAKEHFIAHRILENTGIFGSWELEHSGLMRQVSEYRQLRNQAAALRQTALRLIHGKALFEYLKTHRVRGEVRAKILAHFYPTRMYQFAVVQEHSTYLRKACSLLCTSHLGTDVVADESFLDPMQQYETLYGEYFDMYCNSLFPRDGASSDSEGSLLPLLKHQLNEWRYLIMNPVPSKARLRRETQLRRPLGDTQRMSTLKK